MMESLEEDIEIEDEQSKSGSSKSSKATKESQIDFNTVEIAFRVLKPELESIRELYWHLSESIDPIEDFGFVYLDCLDFKEKALTQVYTLQETLEHYAS